MARFTVLTTHRFLHLTLLQYGQYDFALLYKAVFYVCSKEVTTENPKSRPTRVDRCSRFTVKSPKTRVMSPKIFSQVARKFIELSNILTSSSRLFRFIKSLRIRYITHLTCLFRFIKAKTTRYITYTLY